MIPRRMAAIMSCCWMTAVCFIAQLWTLIYAQALYHNDMQQQHFFNQDSSEVVLQTLLDNIETLLSEKNKELAEIRTREKLLSLRYQEILSLYNTKDVPDGTTIDELCVKHPDIILRSPTDCHQYYNCSTGVKTLQSCSFPYLFSEVTLQCENYTKVYCGDRFEPKYICEYPGMSCMRAHCIPCSSQNPDCRQQEDGLQSWPYRLGSSWYVVCENGRAIETGSCPTDKEWNTTSLPYKGHCVHRFAVPTVYNPGGALPSCDGKIDGNYQYPERPCDAYYTCRCGVASAVKCPSNTVFDVENKRCQMGGTCIT